MRGNSSSQRLKQPVHADHVAATLDVRRLVAAYHARPAYQQNDYIGWITRAKRPETRTKRLNQMLDELEKGGVCMRMASKR